MRQEIKEYVYKEDGKWKIFGNDGGWTNWEGGENTISLDADYTLKELEDIIEVMKRNL